jgi:hypothetical protein
VEELEKEGVTEPFQFLGVFAKQGWYILQFTGQCDPMLLTYLGLWGVTRESSKACGDLSVANNLVRIL